MCGIIGYIGSKPVVPVLIEGLRRMHGHVPQTSDAEVAQAAFDRLTAEIDSFCARGNCGPVMVIALA